MLASIAALALGFIGLFVIGGLTGIFLGVVAIDIHVTDTYFVVAHFHYVMVGGTIMGYLGGLHYWWPKMTGRLYPAFLSRLSALLVFVGFNLTFFPQFVLGYLGMPRRYWAYPEEFQVLNVLSTAGASASIPAGSSGASAGCTEIRTCSRRISAGLRSTQGISLRMARHIFTPRQRKFGTQPKPLSSSTTASSTCCTNR